MKKSIFAPWLVRFYRWHYEYRRPSWWVEYHRVQQDNFCHFGRVVFFWAPLRWFFCRRMALGIRPWMPVIPTAYALLLAAAPGPMVVLTLVAAFQGGLLLFLSRIEKVERFLGRAVVGRVRVWHVLLTAALAVSLYAFPAVVVTIIVAVAAIAVAGLVLVGAIGLAIKGVKSLRTSFPFRILRPQVRVSVRALAPVRNAAENVGGILSTAWHFLVLLKRRTICPWVSFSGGRIEFYWPAKEELS